MSNTISKIDDDYDWYCILCKKFNESSYSINLSKNWTRHLRLLEQKDDLNKYDLLNNKQDGE